MITTIAIIFMFIAGLHIGIQNWRNFIASFSRDPDGYHPSYVPFVGGIFLAVAWSIFPYVSIRPYWYLAFFIDFGCIFLPLCWIFRKPLDKIYFKIHKNRSQPREN